MCQKMAELDELVIAKKFALFMDNLQDWPSYDLSDSAIMDWFGRTLYGRDAIVSFMKTYVPKMHHTIESVTKIPPISHRSLQRSEAPVRTQSPVRPSPSDRESCKTPENMIRPNLQDLMRAPSRRRKKIFCVGSEEWQFAEIRGRLHFEEMQHNEVGPREKMVQRIVLGYTDQIHFIVYEGKVFCRKKLFSLSNT
ncbi:uncharacterized protein LOC124360708 isoform X2 [Homalodisca vitripennis]|uniref:uncharacterized protein LOC124360708 isoform X2 n=1 Tax=Homalodisca vitripennis TaxID=197043 RepID=UPI001EEC82EA|nr:uncharacterized protein LOC124360708 isoform X2 [Homalodisca vitripennis]